MDKWLGLGAFTTRDPGSRSGCGTKIPQTMWLGHETKQTKKKIEHRAMTINE